jgi:hypothetical protein
LVHKRVWFILLVIILSFAAAAVLAEVSLGYKERYTKKPILDYIDTKRPESLRWGGYLKENFNTFVTDGLGGKVRWTNNAQGFRSDQEFSPEPPPGVLRILSLGDSFNAGFRVGQDDALSHLREEWINRNFGPAEILVPETEDPGHALAYLVKFGLRLRPQIVLLGITLGNDIVQAYQNLDARGAYQLSIDQGQVRFEAGKAAALGFQELAARKIPSIYLKSESTLERSRRRAGRWLRRRRLLRPFYQEHEAVTSWGDRDNLSLFDPNNGFGVFTSPLTPEIEAAYRRLFRILEAFATICKQHDIIFAVQIFPQRYQIQPEDWVNTVDEYGLNPSRFDLMAPDRKIAAFCRQHRIRCFDPTAAMARRYAETKQPMYLPRGDMHWNKTGHRVFFECSQPAFAELIREGFQKVKDTNPTYLHTRPRASADGQQSQR